MAVFYFMIPFMLLIGLILLGFFIWAAKSGQYEDLEAQKYRIFFEDDSPVKPLLLNEEKN